MRLSAGGGLIALVAPVPSVPRLSLSFTHKVTDSLVLGSGNLLRFLHE